MQGRTGSRRSGSGGRSGRGGRIDDRSVLNRKTRGSSSSFGGGSGGRLFFLLLVVFGRGRSRVVVTGRSGGTGRSTRTGSLSVDDTGTAERTKNDGNPSSAFLPSTTPFGPELTCIHQGKQRYQGTPTWSTNCCTGPSRYPCATRNHRS